MVKLRSFAVGCTLVGAIACSAGDLNTAPPGTPLDFTRLRAEPYSFTYSSGFDQSARLIIRDQAAWQAAWLKVYARSSPIPPLPDIDFSRETVILVALGAHSTGGYGILINGALATDAGTSVVVRSILSRGNCATTQAFTQPVDIARIPRRDGDVSFIEQTDYDC